MPDALAQEIAVSLEPREIAAAAIAIKHGCDERHAHGEKIAHAVAVSGKLCAALGMHNTTPWDERTYLRLRDLAEGVES